MTKEAKILFGIAGAVIAAGLALAIFANPQPEQAGKSVDERSLIRENSHVLGNSKGKAVVVEFADFQCPACASANPILQQIKNEYKDNPEFGFVFRHFPLSSIHSNAKISANAAEAAGSQGKFWEMVDKLYANQEAWASAQSPADEFAKYASEIGINVDQFKADVSNRKFDEIISADLADGEKIGVNSTPTIFINGEKIEGYKYDDLKAKIEAALNPPAATPTPSRDANSQPSQAEASASTSTPTPANATSPAASTPAQ